MVQRFDKDANPNKTDQKQPIIGRESEMVKNSEGGYVFPVDVWKRLERFLIIGTENGTYYAKQKDITEENIRTIIKLIATDGKKVVNKITEISQQGRAHKNNPAIYVLALCLANGNTETKRAAVEAVPKICRTGTHFFHFLLYIKGIRGIGRLVRKAISKWYNEKDADKLTYQILKYRQRDGWTHRDALRLGHPKAPDEEHDIIYKYITQKEKLFEQQPLPKIPDLIQAFEKAQAAENEEIVIKLIEKHNLPREFIPTEFLKSPEVWEALLQKMPFMAMVRNLATMTKIGLLKPFSDANKIVLNKLGNDEIIKKSRIHPIHLLAALLTYKAGKSARGKSAWNPIPQIIDTLDNAFYKAFENIEPTGKNWLIGLDVSGSMSAPNLMNIPDFTPYKAAAALAMTTIRSEQNYMTMAFADNFRKISLSPKMRLDTVVSEMEKISFGRTDCSLPMVYAIKNRIYDIDIFAVYTDNQTYAGRIHPAQALKQYRQKSGKAAKLIVLGCASDGFTIADSEDAGMLDIVGFDSATPQVIADFAREDK